MFKRLISVWLLLATIGLAQDKVIPAAPVSAIVRTGAVHAAVVWVENGVRRKERITQAQYAANPRNNPPAGFGGTAQEWAQLWDSRQAYALGGRPTLNTPSGEPELGTIELQADGSVWVYLGDDLDVGAVPSVVLSSAEYVGPFPNITTPGPKCGLSIIAGQIQAGTVNASCSRNSRSPRARVGK